MRLAKKILKICWRLFLAALLVAAAVPAAEGQPGATSDRVISGASYYITVASATPWSQLSANYIFTPQSPNVGLCIFVENNNPTNAHAITLGVYQTGDPALAQFAGKTSLWAADQMQNAPTSVPASSMASFYVNAQGAANVAIAITGVAAAAGTPDTANVFAVQSTSPVCGAAVSGLYVQGVVAPGVNSSSVNPVLAGGQDVNTSKAYPLALLKGGADTTEGLEMGGINGLNNAMSVGAAALFGSNENVPLGAICFGIYSTAPSAQPCELGFFGKGLLVSRALQTDSHNATITANTTYQLFNASTQYATAFTSCEFTLHVTSVSGSTPTLNVYIQSSDDDATWNDVVSFNQVTAASTQVAGVSDAASIAPATYKTNSLTAGTVLNGPLGEYLRISYVVGGGTPSFTQTLYASCR